MIDKDSNFNHKPTFSICAHHKKRKEQDWATQEECACYNHSSICVTLYIWKNYLIKVKILTYLGLSRAFDTIITLQINLIFPISV